jgi:opacity protein-like surface antigen
MKKFLVVAAFVVSLFGATTASAQQVQPVCTHGYSDLLNEKIEAGWDAKYIGGNRVYDSQYWVYISRRGYETRESIFGMFNCAMVRTASIQQLYVTEADPVKKEQLRLLTAATLRITTSMGDAIQWMDANLTATIR